MRMRKRVTLMVVTVTTIFGICWGTASVVYVLYHVASYNIGLVPTVIINIMVLFNSAVNPFVYALLNKQFREKIYVNYITSYLPLYAKHMLELYVFVYPR